MLNKLFVGTARKVEIRRREVIALLGAGACGRRGFQASARVTDVERGCSVVRHGSEGGGTAEKGGSRGVSRPETGRK